MEKKKVVALVEPTAGNLDASFQEVTLRRYAERHGLGIDLLIGGRTPHAGASGKPEHRNLLNDINNGEVGRLLVLQEVRHYVPEELLTACRKAGVKVDFIDVQQERGA